MKSTFYIVAAFFIITVSACGQNQKPEKEIQFPKPVGYVNDFGNVFSVREEKILDSLIKNFEQRSSVQIKVVTLDSTMTTLERFNSYTLRMANAWEVGKEKRNGILIGISPSLQRVRINRGLGVEKALTSVKTKQILDDFMFPELRKGNYFEGTRIAILELVRILE